MKIIIIEDCVYKVTNKQFKIIKSKENSLEYSDFELEMDTYLLENISKYKLIGNISYQFRI